MFLLYAELAHKDDYYWFGLFEKKSGLLVGAIDIDVLVRGSHEFANFGYAIYNRHWGRSYGQEAAKAGLKIGFKYLKLNRLEAAINLDNRKSVRLAKAIGMRKEGIKRRYWFEHGKWTDHLIYVANPEDVGLKPTKPTSS
ncbi:GNAT family N-acetyltransferase [Bdellovibrio sp. GT3]|uniref:GNAT family N-acetyltransferase n=1 Tax=Bdellovibrio sp. GT3 TaxID=3136282 RepID=UPI0030F0706F